MKIIGRIFFVIGVSKSGFSACEYILNKGGICYFYEENDSEKIKESISRIKELGGIRVYKEDAEKIVSKSDMVVISPGIPINHEIAVLAKHKGKRLIGELEFGYQTFIPQIVAVTGTNGKTTTVSLIDHIIKNSNHKVIAVGNIGIPITSKLDEIDGETIVVAEVSSFQLESISAFCPYIACILNVTPDHLKRHYTMENYAFLKKKILFNQRESDYSILNYDDEIVKNMFTEAKSKVIWVSKYERVEGCYINGGNIYYNDEKIIEIKDLPINGEHNQENVMFAIAVCKVLGIGNEEIANCITSFKGISNRIEYIAEKNGVDYYNDSKATNTSSTLSAIKTMTKPTILILGGREKGEEYDVFFKEISNSCVKHIILTGESRFNMLEEAEKQGIKEITLIGDFSLAIKVASLIAKNGESVLLSPACSSFDSFNSYEERGDKFRKIVENFNE